MSAQSLAERFHMTQAEGEEFYAKYKAALPTLFAWEHRIQNKGKREGTVYNYFGRPRRVRFYFTHGRVGFGYRTVVNNTVQSTAADILKISVIKLWRQLFYHPDNMNDIRFITTVHDRAA
jgi:DNA polymerase I-like protein with 3'-5' exonuclease and polymerase domains